MRSFQRAEIVLDLHELLAQDLQILVQVRLVLCDRDVIRLPVLSAAHARKVHGEQRLQARRFICHCRPPLQHAPLHVEQQLKPAVDRKARAVHIADREPKRPPVPGEQRLQHVGFRIRHEPLVEHRAAARLRGDRDHAAAAAQIQLLELFDAELAAEIRHLRVPARLDLAPRIAVALSEAAKISVPIHEEQRAAVCAERAHREAVAQHIRAPVQVVYEHGVVDGRAVFAEGKIELVAAGGGHAVGKVGGLQNAAHLVRVKGARRRLAVKVVQSLLREKVQHVAVAHAGARHRLRHRCADGVDAIVGRPVAEQTVQRIPLEDEQLVRQCEQPRDRIGVRADLHMSTADVFRSGRARPVLDRATVAGRGAPVEPGGMLRVPRCEQPAVIQLDIAHGNVREQRLAAEVRNGRGAPVPFLNAAHAACRKQHLRAADFEREEILLCGIEGFARGQGTDVRKRCSALRECGKPRLGEQYKAPRPVFSPDRHAADLVRRGECGGRVMDIAVRHAQPPALGVHVARHGAFPRINVVLTLALVDAEKARDAVELQGHRKRPPSIAIDDGIGVVLARMTAQTAFCKVVQLKAAPRRAERDRIAHGALAPHRVQQERAVRIAALRQIRLVRVRLHVLWRVAVADKDVAVLQSRHADVVRPRAVIERIALVSARNGQHLDAAARKRGEPEHAVFERGRIRAARANDRGKIVDRVVQVSRELVPPAFERLCIGAAAELLQGRGQQFL
nr:MAG TPA: hypothetical protein [Caudoviricetes sp.]